MNGCRPLRPLTIVVEQHVRQGLDVDLHADIAQKSPQRWPTNVRAMTEREGTQGWDKSTVIAGWQWCSDRRRHVGDIPDLMRKSVGSTAVLPTHCSSYVTVSASCFFGLPRGLRVCRSASEEWFAGGSPAGGLIPGFLNLPFSWAFSSRNSCTATHTRAL